MKRLAVFVAILIAVLCAAFCLVLFVAAYVADAEYVESARVASKAEYQKHKKAFVEDVAWAKKQALLKPASKGADAAQVFDALVGWNHNALNASGSLTLRYERDKVAVDAFLKREAKTPLTKDEVAFLETFDFAWLAALKNFDHWSFSRAMPSGVKIDGPYGEPTPNLSALVRFHQLNLYQKRAKGNTKLAVSESFHLARLLVSSEDMIGALVGIAILKQVAKIAPEEALMSDDELVRAERVLLATSAAWSLFLSDDERREVAAASSGFIGECVAFNEGTQRLWPFTLLLEPRYESIFRELKTFEGRDCRLDLAKAFRARHQADVKVALETTDISSTWLWVPFMKDIAASLVLSIHEMNPFRRYEE